MKTEMARRVVVVIGTHGAIPPLVEPSPDVSEVLVLAIGPRPTSEQQRAVEEAVALSFEHRVPFEARIVSTAEAAALLASARADASMIRTLCCSRRDLRTLRRLGR